MLDRAVDVAPVAIVDLASDMCRWPLWDHQIRTPAGLYCGATLAEGSFCAAHARMAYTPAARQTGRMAVNHLPGAVTSPAPRRLDDLGSVQDGRKMSTDGQPSAGLDIAVPQRDSTQEGVTAGETASHSGSENTSCLSVSPETCEPAPAMAASTGRQQRDTLGVTAGETAPFHDRASQDAHYKAVRARLFRAVPPIGEAEAPPAEAPPTLEEALAPITEGPSNALALAALRALLAGELPGNLLYLHGPEGCGKTLMAIAARRLLGAERVSDNADRLERRALLRVLDMDGGRLVLGRGAPCDSAHGELIGRAVVIEIGEPDETIRVLAVDQIMGGRHVTPEARAAIIGSELGMAMMIGMARSLAFVAGANGTITAEQVAIACATFGGRRPQRVRVDDIKRAAATFYGVTVNDIVSQRRTARVVKPRQMAMYLAKTLTPCSLPEIGRRFGGRDHTTVLHAVAKLTRQVEIDRALAAEAEKLTALIREGVA